jgi:hypothetical protein
MAGAGGHETGDGFSSVDCPRCWREQAATISPSSISKFTPNSTWTLS